MSRYFYDLHVHSCLSPCGDDDMTPANIAGMASLKGLGIVALTDHNSAKNCPAFFTACERCGIIPVAGMELTTSEDVHLVCLFPDLSSAAEFEREIARRRPPVRNRPEIFGRQLIMDAEDGITGKEENLLLNAADITLECGKALCESFGGAAYPAHIDRESNGIIAVLGDFPPDTHYAYELADKDSAEEYAARFPHIANLQKIVSSDAHYLWNISEPESFFELEGDSADAVRRSLISHILHGAEAGR